MTEETGKPGAARFWLTVYLLPLFALGKVWASVGKSPLYVPDLLALLAALAALPATLLELPRRRAVAAYLPVAFVLAVLVARGVYQGHHEAYLSALKYAVMGIYPLIAFALAGWLAGRQHLIRLIGYPVLLIPVGLAVVRLGHLADVPSAYGLYLGIGIAFAITGETPRRRAVRWAVGIGWLLLVVISSRRGVILVGIATALAVAAAGRERKPPTHRPNGALIAVLGLIGVGLAASMFVTPSHWPVVGHAASRLGDTFVTTDSNEANANAEVRTKLWSYALSTTWHEHPFIGEGAGHPVDVVFGTNNFSTQSTGVHNSFVGYVFYYGYPAGVIVAGLFVWMLGRAWRRRREPYGAALFGCVVAVILTALTNVALESPYIAGPSWLVVAAVLALGPADRPREVDLRGGRVAGVGRESLELAGHRRKPVADFAER